MVALRLGALVSTTALSDRTLCPPNMKPTLWYDGVRGEASGGN